MNAQYATKFLSPVSARLAVWIPALCVRSVNTVAKLIAYYTLAILMAVIPFGFLCLVMVNLSQIIADTYTLLAIYVVLYGLYAIYLLWMFASDEDLEY